MARVTIPAGISLRQVAERLQLPPEELKKHAKLRDVERTYDIDRFVEVPDGFLRKGPTQQPIRNALSAERMAPRGASDFVALDIEHKREQIAGVKGSEGASEDDEDALHEAERAYARLESDSNELAQRLFHQVSGSGKFRVRARGHGGEALTWVQQYYRFGKPETRCRQNAISSGKAAIMADPKLPEGHMGLGLGLSIEADDPSRQQAFDALERAVSLNVAHVGAWVCLGEYLLLCGETRNLTAICERALSLDPNSAPALELHARWAQSEGNMELARDLLEKATDALATYANAPARLSLILFKMGEDALGQDALDLARERAGTEAHTTFVEDLSMGIPQDT